MNNEGIPHHQGRRAARDARRQVIPVARGRRRRVLVEGVHRSRLTRTYNTISFLSDYGLADEFVGVVKSVIRSIAPDVVVIDLTHEIEPHDVRGGGLTLARSAQYLAPGIVLAVVDPGVATPRRAIAVE